MSEIQRADPKARRRNTIISIVLLVVFVPLLFWFKPYVKSLEPWISEPGETVERVKFSITLLISIGAVLLILITTITFKFANAVLESNRYPPPSIKVIRDTRIRRDEAARKMGRLIQAYGVVVIIFLVVLILAGWKLIQNVESMVS